MNDHLLRELIIQKEKILVIGLSIYKIHSCSHTVTTTVCFVSFS